MLIDITDILSEQHKTIEKDVMLEMTQFHREGETFAVTDKSDVHICVEYVQKQEILITGNAKVEIALPCARCLKDVKTPFSLEFRKAIDLSEATGEAEDDYDEKNFIEGHHLDVEQLICNELLVEWPMKVLCDENCEGIVYEKEETLDPRMAAALDIFKQFQGE